ncbi:LPXTG cell wall anchor domain-containing protein [Streptococcus parauberis]|uniref:LPXTG cell wall anchor domain-containing protein n=1 Tax=Streptococcus parauberis TaxID=1348 RepID=UPI000C150698|nr:LPXTG cell wall anchor domain-containing protein [Streptococcus parauberis]PIA85274.1 hypothetical protein ADO07_00619 [Streptococcus parauberis]PNY21834.1 hypothetical protein ASN88_01169 [Streptococcus parauberis]
MYHTKDRQQRFSLRKFKLGLGAAIIGLAFASQTSIFADTPSTTTDPISSAAVTPVEQPTAPVETTSTSTNDVYLTDQSATDLADAEISAKENLSVEAADQAQIGDVIDVTVDEGETTETEYDDGVVTEVGTVTVKTTSIADPSQVQMAPQTETKTYISDGQYLDGQDWINSYEEIAKTTTIEYVLASNTTEWTALGDKWLKIVTESYDYYVELSADGDIKDVKKINPSAYKPKQISPTSSTRTQASDEKFTKSELPETGDHSQASLAFMGIMMSAIALVLAKKYKHE